jgi:alanyl-tRNA synthetase
VTGHEIRQKFLDFFAGRGHRVVRSSSLVPANDPTLLFTNAGMNQFKDVFLGLEKRDYTRATTAQKCVRAGGKHNDLENVGYTRRHHTFFEMMGNFSFGDYFKADAIQYAWELVTQGFGMPKDRLYITVFREDDEAEELWQKVAGVSKDRIFRLDEKDNFWQMGETGPCGPCSEIHYDLGPEAAAPGREHEQFPDDAGGRFVEIWNLVFMQYDRDAEGRLTPLPKPSIDTGLGLERVAAILQGKFSNFECDLLFPIVQEAGRLLKVSYGEDEKTNVVLRICADHARAAAFLIHDGVLPSNEGRGYVLRKIMRRAMRNARRIGAAEPFLYQLTGFVAEWMKPAYPELLESVPRVARIVLDEEKRYASTFQIAERVFHDEARAASGGVLPGAAAFKLYDTYGMALDEQLDMARELGLAIDMDGFEQAMQRQRERARASWKGAEKAQIAPVYQQLVDAGATQFLGYEHLAVKPCEILALIVGQTSFREVPAGAECEIVLDRTPFYAESGGQVGDTGRLLDPETGAVLADVASCFRPVPGLHVHKARALATLRVGAAVEAAVDEPARRATMRNHTGTHLLHAALRQVLGAHVKQAGSVVEPARLRFDFTHYAPVAPEELAEIERLANEAILRDMPVSIQQMEIEKALETGAMALFGEKYGDRVRVVAVGDFSRELCGGTHVRHAGEIGLLKVVSEGSIASGVRRVEALTGSGALERFQHTAASVQQAASLLRTSEHELLEQIEKLLAQQKALERQLEALKEKAAHAAASDLESQAREIRGVKVLSARVDALDRAQMRNLADALRNKWKSAVVLLASPDNGQVSLVCAVTKDLTAKVHAGKLVGQVAQALGGRGGGRPDLAEAGGKDASALPGALAAVYQSVEQWLA